MVKRTRTTGKILNKSERTKSKIFFFKNRNFSKMSNWVRKRRLAEWMVANSAPACTLCLSLLVRMLKLYMLLKKHETRRKIFPRMMWLFNYHGVKHGKWLSMVLIFLQSKADEISCGSCFWKNFWGKIRTISFTNQTVNVMVWNVLECTFRRTF